MHPVFLYFVERNMYLLNNLKLPPSHGQKMVSINQLEMDMKLFCYPA